MNQRSLRFPSLIAAAAAALFFHAAPALAQGAAPAAAPVDPVKLKLIEQILAIYQPETFAVVQAQQLGTDTMNKAALVLQQNHVPPAKAEATMKDVATDVQKFVNTITPIVADDAKKQVVPTAAPIMAKNFSVDELKQILTLLQMPVRKKFEKVVPQIETAVFTKVKSDVGAQVEKAGQDMNKAAGPKLQAAVMTTAH